MDCLIPTVGRFSFEIDVEMGKKTHHAVNKKRLQGYGGETINTLQKFLASLAQENFIDAPWANWNIQWGPRTPSRSSLNVGIGHVWI